MAMSAAETRKNSAEVGNLSDTIQWGYTKVHVSFDRSGKGRYFPQHTFFTSKNKIGLFFLVLVIMGDWDGL